jgi:hypothetical protein
MRPRLTHIMSPEGIRAGSTRLPQETFRVPDVSRLIQMEAHPYAKTWSSDGQSAGSNGSNECGNIFSDRRLDVEGPQRWPTPLLAEAASLY